MGTRCTDHVTPLYPLKLALTSPTGGGRSVGIVRSRTKATEFFRSLVRLVGFLKGKDFNYEVRKRIGTMAPWSKVSSLNVFVLPQDRCRNI